MVKLHHETNVAYQVPSLESIHARHPPVAWPGEYSAEPVRAGLAALPDSGSEQVAELVEEALGGRRDVVAGLGGELYE